MTKKTAPEQSGKPGLRPKTFGRATALFFFSGALGLGYELVWIKKAALVVGASQIALSTVLTSFFLGIALGGYFVGSRLRSTRRSPLFIYGIFELVIGLFALAFPFLFFLLEQTYGALYPVAAGVGGGLFALRFGLLFALVLIPTFFMGGTLPLLLDGLVAEDRAIGSRTSFLYGVNILGAVAGVLCTAYFAIPALGMNGTSVAGGIGNLLIAAAAFLFFRQSAPTRAIAGEVRLGWFFPAAAFLSGLVAIAYQVAWSRYFSLFHTTSVYFTAMLLAVYLLALAAGSLALSPVLRTRWSPLTVLGGLQGLVPFFALTMIYWWRSAEHSVALHGKRVTLPDGSVQIVPLETLEIDHLNPSYMMFWSEKADAIFFAPLFQIALCIFIPVALMGAGLPALIAAAARSASTLRPVSGRLVFWNTLGSSLGGFLAGYVFLHFLGLHATLVLLGAGSLVLSGACLLKTRSLRLAGDEASSSRSRGGLLSAAAPLLGLAGVLYFSFSEDITRQTILVDGYGKNPARGETELVEINEGPLTTSWIFDGPDSIQVGAGHVSLAVTYKKYWSTQAIQGHVPMLFYPGTGLPRDCLGICLGSGQSFGALLMYLPEDGRLDVVDISEEMIELSLRNYGEYNHGLGKDGRVRVHLDDGRHYVDRAPASSYDIISMEPPPPTADGVCSLYSREFYSGIRRILRPGGVFMQWLPLYRITPADTLGIVKTQAAEFPFTFVVKVGRDDFMVLSYPSRPRFELETLRQRSRTFARENKISGSRWTTLCRHEMSSLEGVLSTLVMGPEEIAGLDAPMLYEDDTQRLSYSSGDRELLRLYRGPALSPLAFAALRLSPFTSLSAYFNPPLEAAFAGELERERACALAFFRVPDPARLASQAQAYTRSVTGAERAAWAIAMAGRYDAALKKEAAFEWIGKALDNLPGAAQPAQLRRVREMARNRIAVYHAVTEKWIRALEKGHPGSPLVVAMRAELDGYKRRAAAKNARYLFP
ncbi:MAG: hypothetical protein VX958_05585 [Planctomycetota bacterium]|nr:hypothetical protein [Planctomycetota bacterium]